MALVQLLVLLVLIASSVTLAAKSRDKDEKFLLPQIQLQDVELVRTLRPLKKGDNIMFWRLQKVGSSTMLSLFVSYAYRYHFLPRRKAGPNAFCRLIASCAVENDRNASQALLRYVATSHRKGELLGQVARTIRFKMSISHDICDLSSEVVARHLPCAFQQGRGRQGDSAEEVREVFMVREPVARLVSVYYFWGELFKLQRETKAKRRRGLRETERREGREEREVVAISPSSKRERKASSTSAASRKRRGVLGSSQFRNQTLAGALFTYHGNEATAPPLSLALAFAASPPLKRGFPGPSLSSSAFAALLPEALRYMSERDAKGRLFTVVLERLDESLVVLRRHLGWSLSDVLHLLPRKALSLHPAPSSWPPQAVALLRERLRGEGEYEVYERAGALLSARIASLEREGVDVQGEVAQLRRLRERVGERCLNMTHLERYREEVQRRGFPPHPSQNKLRDYEEVYLPHLFSLNGEIFSSLDLCAPCEGAALLLSGGRGGYFDLERGLREQERQGGRLSNCPAVK